MKRFFAVLLTLALICCTFTSCFDRTVHLMETDLSEGLIRIDYVNIDLSESGDEYYNIEVYKTLDLEEQDRVLSEIKEIEFLRNIFPRYPELYGDGLIFCYASYRLFVTSHTVYKEPFDSVATGEPLWYDIGYSDQLVELLNTLKNS